VELETIKLLLQLPNLLSVCHHAGVMTFRLSDDLVDDELRVTAYIKPLNPKLGSDAHAIDECLVLCHIVGCAEVQSNHVQELIPLRRDRHYASPGLVEGERAIKIHAPVLLGDCRGGGLLSLTPFGHETIRPIPDMAPSV
jgi:hypothetical protein